MSVTATILARLVPIEIPVGPDQYGRIPTFRWFGKHQLTGDLSGGVMQVGFTLPTGVEYKGTEWTFDMYSLTVSTGAAGAEVIYLEVRGGEIQGATALDWWRALLVDAGATAIGWYHGDPLPGWPFRMEGQNSYVRTTWNSNHNGVTYEFSVGGHIYLPANLSRQP